MIPKYEVYYDQQQGKRESQEDCFLINRDKSLFAVADGIGGHLNGEVAAQDVVISLSSIEAIDLSSIVMAIWDADKKCQDRNDNSGATVSVVWLTKDNKLGFCHAGDSRVYIIDAEAQVTKLTTDHQLPNGMLYNCVGFLTDIEFKVMTCPEPGSLIVIATDGSLYGVEPMLGRLLKEADPAKFLNTHSYANGSTDNATCVVIKLV